MKLKLKIIIPAVATRDKYIQCPIALAFHKKKSFPFCTRPHFSTFYAQFNFIFTFIWTGEHFENKIKEKGFQEIFSCCFDIRLIQYRPIIKVFFLII